MQPRTIPDQLSRERYIAVQVLFLVACVCLFACLLARIRENCYYFETKFSRVPAKSSHEYSWKSTSSTVRKFHVDISCFDVPIHRRRRRIRRAEWRSRLQCCQLAPALPASRRQQPSFSSTAYPEHYHTASLCFQCFGAWWILINCLWQFTLK